MTCISCWASPLFLYRHSLLTGARLDGTSMQINLEPVVRSLHTAEAASKG